MRWAQKYGRAAEGSSAAPGEVQASQTDGNSERGHRRDRLCRLTEGSPEADFDKDGESELKGFAESAESSDVADLATFQQSRRGKGASSWPCR